MPGGKQSRSEVREIVKRAGRNCNVNMGKQPWAMRKKTAKGEVGETSRVEVRKRARQREQYPEMDSGISTRQTTMERASSAVEGGMFVLSMLGKT